MPKEMTDEYGVPEAELEADLYHVVGIASQARILGVVIGAKIGSAGADVIEQE